MKFVCGSPHTTQVPDYPSLLLTDTKGKEKKDKGSKKEFPLWTDCVYHEISSVGGSPYRKSIRIRETGVDEHGFCYFLGCI